MAMDKKFFDPTGSGSKGTGIRAIYNHPTDTKATIKTAGYFNSVANEMVRIKTILIISSDATFEAKVSVASGVVTIAALDTFA